MMHLIWLVHPQGALLNLMSGATTGCHSALDMDDASSRCKGQPGMVDAPTGYQMHMIWLMHTTSARVLWTLLIHFQGRVGGLEGMRDDRCGEKVEVGVGIGRLGWDRVLGVEGEGKVGVVRRCG